MSALTSELIRKKFGKKPKYFAQTGDYEGKTTVPGYQYLRYARIQGVVQKVWDRVTDGSPNLDVEVEYIGNQIVVKGLRGRAVPLADGVPVMGPHAESHLEGAKDPVYIWASQILNFRVTPNGFKIQIWKGSLMGNNFGQPARSSAIDLTSYKPVSGALWALVTLDRMGGFHVQVSATADTLALLTASLIPSCPFGHWPVYAIRLYASQNKIWPADMLDLRWSALPYNCAVMGGGDYEDAGVTISSGTITARSRYLHIYSESGSTDDLEWIVGGAHGSIVALCAPSETITIKSGTGNIELPGGTDIILSGGLTQVQVLVYDVLSDTWVAYSGGGGGGSQMETVYWEWDSDAPPASPSAYDDEFDDGSLDTGLWTEYDHGSIQTPVEGDQGLKLGFTGDGSANKTAGVYQAIPAGDFTIETKVSIVGYWATAMSVALALFEDAAYSSKAIRTIRYASNITDPTMKLSIQPWTNWNTQATETLSKKPEHMPVTDLYLRIRRSSSTYSFDYSSDGVGWMRAYTTGSLGITPAHFGLLVHNSTNTPVYGIFRFFRYRSSDVGLDGVCTGRLMPRGGNAFLEAIATKTAAYTVTDLDNTLLGNATGGAFSFNLPTAVGRSGRVFAFAKIDSSANAVTIDGNGSETINGATTVALSTQWETLTIVSDGSNWIAAPNVQLYLKLTGGTLSGDLAIASDSKVIKFGAGADMSIGYDGTKGQIKTNLIAASDLEVVCGTDKTLVLTESVWDDIQFSIATGKVPAANYPDWDTFTANTGEYKFDVNDYIDLQANEMLHWWKEGTTVYPHVHVTTDGANSSGSSQYAKFTVYFAYADGDVWTETTENVEVEIPTGTADMTDLFASGDGVALSGKTIGTQVKCRLKRIAATSGTEYPNHIFVTQLGIHAEKDTMGSRQIGTK